MKKIFLYGMSRSGTTLLSTILDSHYKISFGSELLNTWQGDTSVITKHLHSEGDETLLQVSYRISKLPDDKEIGLYLKRCYRAGLTLSDVRQVFCAEGDTSEVTLELRQRLELACQLIELRGRREGSEFIGFKVPGSNPKFSVDCYQDSFALCLYRDPFDVLQSHVRRGFGKSKEKIVQDWLAYYKGFVKAQKTCPNRVMLISYEDLILQPARTLANIFDFCGLSWDPAVLQFYESSSRILDSNHPNSNDLKKNFDANKIGAGRLSLPSDHQKLINEEISKIPDLVGYQDRSYMRKPTGIKSQISKQERVKKQEIFSRKRKFSLDIYQKMFDYAFQDGYEIGTIRDFNRMAKEDGLKYLCVRHDVDHDLDTAIEIARWEHERGIRATYCLLHTAWYYGDLRGDRYVHSDFLIDSIRQLRQLNHEINFHNNLVALALQVDVDPANLLFNELKFFNDLGVGVVGTSTHGDRLCRELNFRNWEIFSECCDDRFGGPRVVRHEIDGISRNVTLGSLKMSDFHLEYEAYDYGKNIYQTDSGGVMRVRSNTVHRAHTAAPNARSYQLDGILTHPVWWDTSGKLVATNFLQNA